MGLFVTVIHDQTQCATGCRECVDACPVDIFAADQEGNVSVVAANEDECTFCWLCLERCPTDSVIIRKEY